MKSGPKLAGGSLADYRALGAIGAPVYASAHALRATIRRRLGAAYADLLAVPQANDSGTRVAWYAPGSGTVIPWSAAGPDERSSARAVLDDARAAFGRLAGAMAGETDAERRTFSLLLPLALETPDESSVFLVNGRPVLTFWGFAPLAPSRPAPVLVEGPPPPTPRLASVAAPKRWSRWAALLLVPLLLVGLVALYVLWDPFGDGLCEVPSDTGREVVFVLDVSRSMGFAMNPRLPNGKARPMPQTQHPSSRLDAATGAIAKVVDVLPAPVDIGVVLFGNCGSTQSLGMVPDKGRAELLDKLKAVRPMSGTPLALGLQRGADLLSGARPGSIIVVSDGEESCGGDPCNVARNLKAQQPDLDINIVDVTGEGVAKCLAEITGGKVLTPSDSMSLAHLLRRAATTRECGRSN